jgi:DNA repair protein RadA/Sms
MATTKTLFGCRDCGHQGAQWTGRCAGCGGWGTVEEVLATGAPAGPGSVSLGTGSDPGDDGRVATGSLGLDRVLGGGLVPSSVSLLAGEPGIGKSTLLLQIVAHLSASGRPCLVVSG